MFGFGKTKIELRQPFAGTRVRIAEVPDPVFSHKMVGDGFAVRPAEGITSVEVVAPCAGTLKKVFGTLHAFALVSDEGLEILVHVGLDTVELKGDGFEALAATDDHVAAGQPVIRMDVTKVLAAGKDPVTPVVCTNPDQIAKLEISDNPAKPAAVVTLI